MLVAGTEILLDIEKPVAGGRMLARWSGQVVLVRGAIPGERVRARIDAVERDLAYATTVDVLSPSGDRRPVPYDPTCGGLAFAHIAYPRQLALKAQIVVDAFARIGRLPLEAPPAVVPSPERGYRIRARLHARGRRIGFYREGSRRLCDPAASGQFAPAAAAALRGLGAWWGALGLTAAGEIEFAEDLAGDHRVLHLRPTLGAEALIGRPVIAPDGVDGVTVNVPGDPRPQVLVGCGWVSDPLSAFAPERLPLRAGLRLRRHGAAFFQSNRAIVPRLVTEVLDSAGRGVVLDLYAGVGLFAVTLAAAGCERVEAVELDEVSAQDLAENARPFGAALYVARAAVEDYLRERSGPPVDAVVVDPPRAGLSKAAAAGLLGLRPRRLLYVSCDIATFARDARRLAEGGYRLDRLVAFDMFPATPHVELLGVFAGRTGGPA